MAQTAKETAEVLLKKFGKEQALEKAEGGVKSAHIDKLAEKIAHMLGYEDCGCTRRKTLLNKLFPYKKKRK